MAFDQEELMIEANKIHPFYEKGSFKLKAFEEYLKKNKNSWERTLGRPNTSSDYFKGMAVSRPEIAKLRKSGTPSSRLKILKLR